MKQFVLILLFIFTLQRKIHTDPPKNDPKDQHHKRGSSYELHFPNTECEPGYKKICKVIGMYITIKNQPLQRDVFAIK